MWALRLHLLWKSGVMLSLLSAFLILSSVSHQEGKDKSFLLDKLQKLQKLNLYVQKHPNKVCLEVLMLVAGSDVYMFLIFQRPNWHPNQHSAGGQPNAVAQALLPQQTFEEEEERSSPGGVPVPVGNPTSSALLQAMLARQRAEDGQAVARQVPDTHPLSSNAIAQAMQARQAALDWDSNYGAAGFPGNTSSAVAQAMQARRTAEDSPSSSGSDVMAQVMQARWAAGESLQNSAPPGPSALIQAMLARQQAQDEYDDGYWT